MFPYLLFCYCISFILNTTRSIFRYCIVLYVEIFFNALRSMWKFSNTFSTKLILFVKKVATYDWMGADTVHICWYENLVTLSTFLSWCRCTIGWSDLALFWFFKPTLFCRSGIFLGVQFQKLALSAARKKSINHRDLTN